MPSCAISAIDYYQAAHRNILVDALPKLDFGDAILEKISFLPPPPDQAVRSSPDHDRLAFLSELARIHIALNRDRELAQAIDAMIHEGYLARGSVASQRAAAVGRTHQLIESTLAATSQESALDALVARSRVVHTALDTRALIGVSGTGKTRTLHQVHRLYPNTIKFPVVQDPRLPSVVIPQVIVEAPADRTISSLHSSAIRALEILTREEVPTRLKRGNRTERIGALADALQHYHVGLLAIDEIQNLVRPDGRADYVLLNFVLEIANTLRVPILFVGTPASQRLLGNELRNARRLLGRPWANYSAESHEWATLVSSLWPYQFTKQFTPLTHELAATIHDQTVGLPALLIRLYREVQRILILANIQNSARLKELPEIITPDLVQSVARAIFTPVRPMLNALRSGRIDDLALFNDLTLDDTVVEAQIKELAEFRRKEFFHTIRTIRREGSKQRRRAKERMKCEVDGLLGSVKLTSLAGATVVCSNQVGEGS